MWAPAVSTPPFTLHVSAAPPPARCSTRGSVAVKVNSGSSPKSSAEEISGSDVLWALQRATAVKKRNQARAKKKKTAKKMMRGGGENTEEEEEEEEEEVRPIRIDGEWGRRLDDLEGRLEQLSRLI